MKRFKICIKIIFIIIGLTYSNSSLAIHEKTTSNWQDFVLKKGVLILGNKNYLLLAINGETLEFDNLPIGGDSILYFRFIRDLDKKKDCEYMDTLFEISTHLKWQNKKSADEIIGKIIPIKVYDYSIPQQATIEKVNKCPKDATHCFEIALIKIGSTKKVKEFDVLAVEKVKYTLRLFKHPDFDPNIYFPEKTFYNEWDLKHLSKLFKKVKLECKNTFKELSN